MKISAIPTEYKGVRFRSRLEAKWAAFFDLCEWPWSYEPVDLKFYVPDFLLRFDRPLLVEIKPLMSFDESNELNHAKSKARSSGWESEIVILGAEVDPVFGAFYDLEAGWTEATPFHCPDCHEYSMLAEGGSWICRVHGCDLGRRMRGATPWNVGHDFARASRLVQWKAA